MKQLYVRTRAALAILLPALLLLVATPAQAQIVELVKDINPTGDSEPKGFTELGGEIFFRAFGDGTGLELWKTAGTPAGTVLIKDIYPGNNGLV